MKITPQWSIEEDHNKNRGTSLIGRVVYVHCQDPMGDLSYCLSTTHIIGWAVNKEKTDKDYYTFTALSDGMTSVHSLEQLIDKLNRQPYVPIPGSVLQAMMTLKVPLA